MAEVKLNAGYEESDKDTLIDLWIRALVAYGENYCNRKFTNQTWELRLDAFPDGSIDLELPDVSSITDVKYVDAAGALQTLASNQYVLDASPACSQLRKAWAVEWPVTRDEDNAVRVKFVVGYGATAADVDAEVRAWILVRATMLIDSPDGYVGDKVVSMPLIDGMLHTQRIYR